MAEVLVTGDRYLESLVKFVDKNAEQLIDGTIVLKLNPVALHYVQSRLEALIDLERLISGAPVVYLRAYTSVLGDHRALEQLRRILCRLTSLKVVSVLPTQTREPTPLSLLPFGRLKVLELRGNNALTSLRGIENLKSIEDLDLSYNIISNFSELEVVEAREQRCNIFISQMDQAERNTQSCLSALSVIMGSKTGLGMNRKGSKLRTWQLKWFCDESLSKFVALIKVIHAGVGVASSSLSTS